MQYRYKLMDKNKRSIQRESSGPEDNLRQLSLYDDAEGVNNNSYSLVKNNKKQSIIEGWIKEKYTHQSPPQNKTTPLQSYRKILRQPQPMTTRTHYNHISFSPKTVNISEFEFDREVTHHLTQRYKRRPLSSTVYHKNDHPFYTPAESTPIKKVNYNFLRKNSGIKNSKKTLDKDKKIAVQSFSYPMFEKELQLNPQKLIPNIGRISYLAKLKKNKEMLYKF